MGYVIGTGTFPSTWCSMRTIVGATIPPPPAPPLPPWVTGEHNLEIPASAGYLRTIEGNGFIRISTPAVTTAAFIFIPSESDPPGPDYFYASSFPEPYPEQLTGRGVTTDGSAFTITAQAFEPEGQEAGSGGEPPISVEWFQAIS